MDTPNIFTGDNDFNICKSWLCGSTDGQTYSISDWWDKKLLPCPEGSDRSKYDDILDSCFAAEEWEDAIGYKHDYKVDDPKLDAEATAMVDRLDRYVAKLNRQIASLTADGEPHFKTGKHKFTVDVHWDVARSYEVEAESREEAQRIIQEKVERGDVCVWNDGFEATDDVEVRTSGEETPDGEIEYF